jgi:hypothetical protein
MALNLPSASDFNSSGAVSAPPLITTFAFATTAPDGSFTVPLSVSAHRRGARISATVISVQSTA